MVRYPALTAALRAVFRFGSCFTKADIDPGAPTNLDLGVFDRTTSPLISCRTSLSITPNTGSGVTKRASGVLSGIFVHQDYCAVLIRDELSTSNGHHHRMSVSVVACPRNHFRYNSLTVPV